MRSIPLLIIILGCIQGISAQTDSGKLKGTVSYITSQNVYVKFPSTKNISPDDTLFVLQTTSGQSGMKPALIVTNLSSISAVCTPFPGISLVVGDEIVAIENVPEKKARDAGMPVVEGDTASPGQQKAPLGEELVGVGIGAEPETESDTLDNSSSGSSTMQIQPKQDIYGYFGVAAYSNFSNTSAGNSLRMKYTLSFNVKNIGNSNVSAESYMIFTHREKTCSEIQQDVFNGLKIYNLSVNYRFLKHYSIWLGRKINPRLSNVGAIDGLQFDMNFKQFTVGVFGGSRPDYTNYGFDFSLLQFGVYAAHDKRTKNGYLQTTLAFVQQMNAGKTDRQFVYLQHNNSVIRNLRFFGSVEVDLFARKLNPADSTYSPETKPSLTNLYLSLTYRLKRKADFSFSYSARQNVIYYETYKNFLDQLIDEETRQGYLLRVNYRPFKWFSIGASGGYRFQKDDPKPSKNVRAYIAYSRIPGILVGINGNFTWLETSYISGKVYGVGLTRDFLKGKITTGISYKYVDYKLYSGTIHLPQNVAEISLAWRIIRRLALSVYYEGTFQDIDHFNRIYAQFQVRF